ncbi:MULTISPECIES: glycerate kinase [unclassified Imperialibacter]|uniref:glycerate kinase n=1 Tax=unclassified Imperialibacter TaxID=2629706 RepID=UPI00125BA2F5|nr:MULTISPECIES: glycerate kinase [unclassified Imperialibacter]CAD5250994.1 Glycerate 3-kinase [Imperialibacter sp. 89]CAD5283798.1 Glycerate 3-kinase [Imperialibacter sp. 75]VVT10652.1 Glycerate 3-kinase [Imperialibacter sp. EC-SDR9]
MPALKILVAPNAFKSAATAFDIAEAIKKGLQKSKCQSRIVCKPIADGGDGTLPILVDALQGEIFKKEVSDPLGRKLMAPFGYIADKKLAIIEMADASGLRLLSGTEKNAMKASSVGTGELMKEAIDLGATHIILCIGGSATTDGGMGILTALGYKFLNSNGKELAGSGGALKHIAQVVEPKSLTGLHITVLCDVSNPLTGPLGAAAVYGPQKGASPEQVAQLDDGLAHWANLIRQHRGVDVTGVKGGGAAGGISAGLVGWMDAELKPGAEFILELLEMDKAIKETDVVITAEGSLDEQTAEGKGPFVLLEMAEKHRKPVVGLAGRIPREIPDSELRRFLALLPVGNQPESLETAMANTLINIERTAFNLGNVLALQQL